MGQLTFSEEDELIPQSRSRVERVSTMTRLLKMLSFGLIKNERQALITNVVIIIIAIVCFFIFVVFGDKNQFKLPSEDLINAPQPVNR